MNGQFQYGSASMLTSAVTPEPDVEAAAAMEEAAAAARIARTGLPVAAARSTLPEDECCHFVAPVRCGRRRADEFGHLEITNWRLRFHGSIDVNIPWDDVARVERAGSDILVSLRERRRRYRFCCHTIGEAVQGAVVARHLASLSASA